MTKQAEDIYIRGYIQSTFDEFSVDSLGEKPFGIPVCFTTNKKVEDIVAQSDSYEMKALLSLFSQEQNFRNNNGYMNYIGGLDRYGNITNGNDNSQIIKDNIEQLQQTAYQNKMQERPQNGQDYTY